MAITINWSTKVISVPQADLTLISAGLYELNIETFRLALKDIEDSEEGIAQLDTHRRNAPVTLAGVTYAQTFEVINGYTVTFSNTGAPFRVRCVGANHNVGDVTNFDGMVSLIIGNSAGLIVVDSGGGGGPTAAQIADAILARSLAGGADGGRTVRDALRASRNRTELAAGVLTVYAEDDATPAWTAAVATGARDPVTGIDPA